jgi:NADH-quinone oxidoreductase subunit N
MPQVPLLTELRLTWPEIGLVITMCGVILAPFMNRRNPRWSGGVALLGSIVSLLAATYSLDLANDFGFVFSGMITVDYFSQCFKVLLLIFLVLVLAQWWILSSRRPDPGDTPDFLCLLVGAALGMALMSSASSLIMIFIATESASLPSYALAGFRKKHRSSSEASLKYVVFGAASSALMLYGMSLIYGDVGTLSLVGIGAKISSGLTPILAIGLLLMFAGIGFKLSAVPLHFWCPDVFEGAPIEVTTFLSVASKGAAMCLLLRVLATFGASGWPADGHLAGLAAGVALMGGITAIWGNLVAMHQTNIKRLLAYSSIAHAGYMIMTASLICGTDGGTSSAEVSGVILFYLVIYLFMNLGAFTVSGLIAQNTGSEDIRDYAGLLRRSPVAAVLFTLFLLSLFGMPGLGGFMGKVYLMKVMADAGGFGFILIAVLLINTLLSLYYYMRPVYHIVFAKDPGGTPFVPNLAGMVMLCVCAAMLFWTGLMPGSMGGLAQDFGLMHVSPRLREVSQVIPEPAAALVEQDQATMPPNPPDDLTGDISGSMSMPSVHAR